MSIVRQEASHVEASSNRQDIFESLRVMDDYYANEGTGEFDGTILDSKELMDVDPAWVADYSYDIDSQKDYDGKSVFSGDNQVIFNYYDDNREDTESESQSLMSKNEVNRRLQSYKRSENGLEMGETFLYSDDRTVTSEVSSKTKVELIEPGLTKDQIKDIEDIDATWVDQTEPTVENFSDRISFIPEQQAKWFSLDDNYKVRVINIIKILETTQLSFHVMAYCRSTKTTSRKV
jgi:hypothetical protein